MAVKAGVDGGRVPVAGESSIPLIYIYYYFYICVGVLKGEVLPNSIMLYSSLQKSIIVFFYCTYLQASLPRWSGKDL